MTATTDLASKSVEDIRPFLSTIDIAIATDAPGLSAAVDLQANSPVGIMMPSAWTAGNLTFQASFDNSDFGDMRDSAGNEVTVTADTDVYISIDPVDFVGIQYIKVRSGISGTPVVQAAARTLKLHVRRVS